MKSSFIILTIAGLVAALATPPQPAAGILDQREVNCLDKVSLLVYKLSILSTF